MDMANAPREEGAPLLRIPNIQVKLSEKRDSSQKHSPSRAEEY